MRIMNIPGINIQWPWSRLIVEGKKSIETRGYDIPQQYLGIPIAIIETPGPLGKRHGVKRAKVIGIIIFSETFRYESKAKWKKDANKHLVKDDSPFAFGRREETWAWVISEARELKTSAPAPIKRGIVFTKQCLVKN